MRTGFLKTFLAMAATAATLSTPALASDAAGQFAVRGIGGQSCESFTTALAARQNIGAYAQWLMGYASALNRSTPQVFDVFPTESGLDLMGIVGAVCRTNKTLPIEAAANNALRAMAPARMTKSSTLVTVVNGKTSLSLRSEALQLLQTALIRKKFFKGAANGASSPELVKALTEFQVKEAIPVTGLPDIDSFVRAVIKP